MASDGALIHPDSYEQNLEYDSDGNLIRITVKAHNDNIYVQSMTWTAGKLTKISPWVKQWNCRNISRIERSSEIALMQARLPLLQHLLL